MIRNGLRLLLRRHVLASPLKIAARPNKEPSVIALLALLSSTRGSAPIRHHSFYYTFMHRIQYSRPA
jgi:hypothetical protein